MTPEAVTSLNYFPPDWPELEYLVGDNYVGSQLSYIIDGLTPGKDIGIDNNYATILAALVAPLSRGNVTIASPDTADLPVVNPNWLTHPTDQQVAIQSYHRARQFFNSTSMQPVIVGDEVFPGMKVQTDEEILSTIMDSFNTVWHAACTCEYPQPFKFWIQGWAGVERMK